MHVIRSFASGYYQVSVNTAVMRIGLPTGILPAFSVNFSSPPEEKIDSQTASKITVDPTPLFHNFQTNSMKFKNIFPKGLIR